MPSYIITATKKTMLDKRLRYYIDPLLERAALTLHTICPSITANHVTFFGFFTGMVAMLAIWQGLFIVAIIAIICNRLCDGLDGALARQQHATPIGAYYDIVLDFIFYASIPLGFAFYNPADYALYASFLLFSYIGTASSFLAFAIMNEQYKYAQKPNKKGFFHIGGMIEGSETILFMIALCVLPQYFIYGATIFGVLCCLTTIERIIYTGHMFK